MIGLGVSITNAKLTGAGSSPPAFSPTNIPGLLIWNKANDLTTLTPPSGTVTQWANKQSGGYNAAGVGAPVSGSRTLNAKNVIDFDGVDDGFNLGLVPDIGLGHTIFFVGATDTPAKAADQDFLRQLNTSNSTRQRLSYLAGGTGIHYQNGSTGVTYTTAVDSNPHILTQYSFGAALELFIDGPQVATGVAVPGVNAGNMGFARRGNSNGNALDGFIAEVLIYGRALNPTEINQVGNYLASEWGLTWSGATGAKMSVVCFGDSITAGVGASTTPNRWVNQYATSIGYNALAQGISGTLLQNTPLTSTSLPGTNNGRDRYSAALLGGNKADRVVLLYGVNDSRNAGSEPSLNLTDYINDYQEIVDGLIAGGYARSEIIIGSLPYYTSSANPTLIGQYNTAIRAFAVTNQIKFADVYQAMATGGGASLLSGDLLHPNDAGHAVIATAIAAADFVS